MACPRVWGLLFIQANTLQLSFAVTHPGFQQHYPCHMMADTVMYARRNLVPWEVEVLHALLGITSPTTSMAIISEIKLSSCLLCAEKLCGSLVKRVFAGKGNMRKSRFLPELF